MLSFRGGSRHLTRTSNFLSPSIRAARLCSLALLHNSDNFPYGLASNTGDIVRRWTKDRQEKLANFYLSFVLILCISSITSSLETPIVQWRNRLEVMQCLAENCNVYMLVNTNDHFKIPVKQSYSSIRHFLTPSAPPAVPLAPAMATTKVLLLGGHGKVALHLTPLLLAKSWNVTSVVRNPDHESEIVKLGENKSGKVSVLVDSLDDVDSVDRAKSVLDKVDPDIVVWAAGAGGKGGAARTKAVDEVAAKHYISASVTKPSVKKFLMISYIASRHGRPSWWNDEDQKAAENVNTKVLPAYFAAKVEADEHLAAVSKKRNDSDSSFQSINLRPGTLKDDPSTGKVTLGKTGSRGDVSRELVAQVAAGLLDRNDTRGWYDLLNGDEPVDSAIDRLVKEEWDGIVGEDLDRIYSRST